MQEKIIAAIEAMKVNPNPIEGMRRNADIEKNWLLDNVAEVVRKNFQPTVETGDGGSHWYACPHCGKPIDVTGFCGERNAELEAGIQELMDFISSAYFRMDDQNETALELIKKYRAKS
jgi:CRISPR/Cas system-associated protein Cas10 (large subunit of type III CRISPR-Cas system)